MFSAALSGNTGEAVAGAASGAVGAVQDIFAHTILTIMALAIIWTGVKTAVNYDEVTRVAFAPFAKLGDSVTHFVQHIPSYIPTPHPAFTAALNPNNLTSIVDTMRTKLDEKAAAPGKSLAEMISSP